MNPLTRLEIRQPALVAAVKSNSGLDDDADIDDIYTDTESDADIDDTIGDAEERAPSRRVVVDLMQSGQVTFASVDDEPLPDSWKDSEELELTYLDRYSVYTMNVPVVACGKTRLVVSEPSETTRIIRRAYARVFARLPAMCLLLDAEQNQFTAFETTVHDMGGGGLALNVPRSNRLALVASHGEALDAHADPSIVPEGATLVVSVALPNEPPVVVVGTVLRRDGGRARERIIRVEFSLIREADRDRILRFVLLTLAGANSTVHE